MALRTTNPTATPAWEQLNAQFNSLVKSNMQQMFAQDPGRAERFSIRWNDFFVDFSKNIVDDGVMQSLYALAEQCYLTEAVEQYFGGEPINSTENRAVLHTALRSSTTAISVDGYSIDTQIQQAKTSMRNLCDEVISGSRKGYSGKPFTDVVNIGIGGSDLGPAMVVDALQFYKNHLNIHFVSNIDGDHVAEVLKKINPETTLFVIVSKTFTTQETLSNAETIRKWFLESASPNDVQRHFVAVSTNLEKVTSFGIHPDNIFPMWDWVGGRFSLWSTVGLTIALSVGYDKFTELLEGAAEMDEHFRTAPASENIPLTLALLSVWYNNFFGAESHAVIPYTQYLHRLPAYLQQGIMESNGKSIDRAGKKVTYQTGNIIWGEPGTNSQHAFFQLLHQGTKLIPADFIAFLEPLHGNQDHHDKLMSNFFAQTEALLMGKSAEVAAAEMRSAGLSEERIAFLTPFKTFEGNRPTNTILIRKLSPFTLGALVAMYEHKIFAEGIIWNIFSYDQWGVELGKQLANNILAEFNQTRNAAHDASTSQLIRQYCESKNGSNSLKLP